MYRKLLLALWLVILAALAVGVPAFAGGWAVITLDEWPGALTAGTELNIGFMVRQHGITPMADLDPAPTLTLRNPVSAEELVIEAKPQGEAGHYVARVRLPDSGEWQWSIQAFTMDQPMPPLQVSAAKTASAGEPANANTAAAANQTAGANNLLPWLAVGLGIATGACLTAALLAAFNRPARPRWALSLAAIGLLAGAAAGAVATGRLPSAPPVQAAGQQAAGQAAEQTTIEQTTAEQASVQPAATGQVELGRTLFVAKGCITCHRHAGASNSANIILGDYGPILTAYPASVEYLRLWLKDPQAVKPVDNEMPNLGLKETEIEALIAFLKMNK